MLRAPALAATVAALTSCQCQRSATDCEQTPPAPGIDRACQMPGWPDRDFTIHVPVTDDGSAIWPLWIVLHGWSSSKETMALASCPRGDLDHPRCLKTLADRLGFVIVFPDGAGRPRQWDMLPNDADGDDVLYLDELVQHVAGLASVDVSRVRLVGSSQGGGMAYRYACERADRVAAVVGVGAGSMLGAACHPSQPVPVLEFHGDQDPWWPYAGDGDHVSVQQTLVGDETRPGWARLNGCSLQALDEPLPDLTDDSMHSVRTTWPGCRNQTMVQLVTVHGGGHTWPGGEEFAPQFIGHTTTDFLAQDLVVEFFARFAIR